MANTHKQDLAKYIHERLGSTDEMLHEWDTRKYDVNGRVVSKFWNNIQNAPAVVIVGDYDCDGICASHIMSTSIHSLYPNKRIKVRIPRRFSEGYGINMTIAEDIVQNMPAGTLVITVDNGIAAAEVLEYLQAHGFPVALTDHHELRKGCKIPNVDMVIDPSVKELDNPFEGNYWCGAAVAYKLCEPMINSDLAKDMSVFAGVATVADCMDLKEGNWGLVRHTIQAFRNGTAPVSLCNLLKLMKQDPAYCMEDTIGFYLGPAFNAPGRLMDKGATEVLKYLNSPTDVACENIVALNEQRKSIRDDEYQQVVVHLQHTGHINDCPLWVSLPGLHEGIVGILAGKLSEEFKRPAIVLTNVEGKPGVLKGSARNYGDFNIFQYLSSIPAEDFLRMGGHKGAAGLSMTEEAFEKVRNAYPVDLKEIQESTIGTKIHMAIDKWEIPGISQVLDKFRPFGQGNEAPEFEVEIDMNKDHAKMLKDLHLCVEGPRLHPDIKGDFSVKYKLMHFNHVPNDLKDPEHFKMLGTIGESGFGGIVTPQFLAEEVMDIDEDKQEDSNMEERK